MTFASSRVGAHTHTVAAAVLIVHEGSDRLAGADRLFVNRDQLVEHPRLRNSESERTDSLLPRDFPGDRLCRRHPHRGMRFLNRFRYHFALRHLEKLAVVTESLLHPHFRNRRDRFLPHRARIFRVHLEAAELLLGDRSARSEFDAPVRHDVEHRDSLRHAHWMVERNRQQADAVAEPNSARHLAERAVPDLGRRRVRPLAEKMMLDGPHRVVAEPVRKFHLLGRLMVDVVHEAGVMRAAPLKLILQRKFHRVCSSSVSQR